jgi:outer membrane autotransporter protein
MSENIPLSKLTPLACLIRRRLVLTGTLSISLALLSPAVSATAYQEGMTAEKDSTLTLNDGDTITVTGSENNLCGICNTINDTNSVLKLGNNVKIEVNGPLAGGIILKGSDSVLNANKLMVNITGRYGIEVNSKNASLDLGSDSKIALTSNSMVMNGIYLSNGSSLRADALTIVTQGFGSGLYITDAGTQADIGTHTLIQTDDKQGTGIYIFGRDNNALGLPASLKASQLTINTTGDFAYGIDIQSNSDVDLGQQTTISTQGEGATGIRTLGTIRAEALHITTAGSNGANALRVREQGSAIVGPGSALYSANSGALVASGEAAIINFNGSETQRNTLFSGGTFGASAQFTGARINLSQTDITLQSDDEMAIGIWALGGGYVQGDNLSITGNNGSMGVYAMTGSDIDLTGKTVITLASPLETAIGTQHNDGYRASRINLSGQADILGSVRAAGGKIALDMTAGSQLTGAAASDGVNGGYLHMRMDRSRWNMPADSVVDDLTLDNSTVNFTAPAVGSRLTVGNLAGNGTFALKTDIVALNSDRLIVTGNSAGSHYLQIENHGDIATTGQEVVTVVETQDGQARFALSSTVRQARLALAPTVKKIELGGYLYALRQSGTDWELAAAGTTEDAEQAQPEPEPSVDPVPPEGDSSEDRVLPEPEPTEDPVPPVTEPSADPVPPEKAPVENPTPAPDPAQSEPEISSSADAGANFLNINYLINYAETQTLLQRFGDLRQKNSLGDGWIRGIGGRVDDFAGGKLSRFSLSYSGMQFGVDKQIAPDTPILLGAFMGLTHGKAHYASGSGDQNSSHAGFYISALANNGLWLDGLVKYSRMKNSFNVRDSQGAMVNGYGAADSYSASLEAGKRFNLTPTEQGFYLEPQLQLSYSRQETDNLIASNGLHIDLDGYDSLLGRASALLGYRLQQPNLQLNLYVKSGIVREFKGDADYRLNGSPERHSFKGNWWNNGLGVSAQIADQHVFYLEGDSSTGQQFNQRQFNAGYRFSF